MEIEVTAHAEERAKERLGLNKKSTQRQAELAYERGVTHGDIKGRLKKWVDWEGRAAGGSLYIVYNTHLFIFRKQEEKLVLITILKIPGKFLNNIKVFLKE